MTSSYCSMLSEAFIFPLSLSYKSWHTSWWSPLFGLHGQSAHYCSHVATGETAWSNSPLRVTSPLNFSACLLPPQVFSLSGLLPNSLVSSEAFTSVSGLWFKQTLLNFLLPPLTKELAPAVFEPLPLCCASLHSSVRLLPPPPSFLCFFLSCLHFKPFLKAKRWTPVSTS